MYLIMFFIIRKNILCAMCIFYITIRDKTSKYTKNMQFSDFTRSCDQMAPPGGKN